MPRREVDKTTPGYRFGYKFGMYVAGPIVLVAVLGIVIGLAYRWIFG